jgi:hypothetical protein
METNILGKISVSSREAFDWAFTWARTLASSRIESEDLLMGISQLHGDTSPLFQMLGSFEIPKDAFYKRTDVNEVSIINKRETVIDWPKNEPIQEYLPNADTEMNPAGLETQDYEHEFMENLAPLLGQTPRSVKRFVNLYWLMKSIALTHSRSFVEPKNKSSEYKQVLLLLAILTGLPAIEVEFFKQIHQVELEHQVVSLAKGGARNSLKKIRDLMADLRKELESKGERQEVAMEELARLETWLAKPKNIYWQNLSLSELGVWATQVKRFSYQMEEV